MPIRPENKALYPPDWPAISIRVRRRARWRCECRGDCGLVHARKDGKQVDLEAPAEARGFRCLAVQHETHPVTGSKVILTVAHLDHDPRNCDSANLRAWCQRCHNRYDAPVRRKGVQERRRAERAVGDLFS